MPDVPPQLFQRLARRTHLLVDFLAVARAGGIRQAAEQVHVSQSALTRRIQELESALGVALFERSVHGMGLTAFGRALLHHAELVEMNCSYAATEIGDLLGGAGGELRIAAGPAWAYELAPEAVAAVKARLPGVKITVLTRMNEVTLPMLAAGRLDVVLGGLPPAAERLPDVRYEPALEAEHVVYASSRHPLQAGRPASLADLVRYPWVWASDAVAGRRLLEQKLQGSGRALPPPSVDSTSIHVGFRLLRDARHLMLLPSTLARTAGRDDLRPLRLAMPLGRYTTGLMYRPSVLRLRAFVEFRAALLAAVESSGGTTAS